MSVEAVLFDFGDTIATLTPSKEEMLRGFLHTKGTEVSLETLQDAYRIVDYCNKQSAVMLKDQRDKKKFLLRFNHELLKVLGLSLKSGQWSEELYDHFRARKRWELFSEVRGALKEIHGRGYRMGILANWDRGLGDLVRNLGIDQYFSHVLCSGEVAMEKPAPEIFLHLLGHMGVAPEEAVYAGNEYETDVVGARNAGLLPVLIDRNNVWPNADCPRCRDLAGLPAYLEKV